MKAPSRHMYSQLDNQQNQQLPKSSSTPHNHNYNMENISGWGDDKPLLECNLNTLGARINTNINRSKQNKEMRKCQVMHYVGESRTSHRRKRTKIVASSSSQRNIECHMPEQSQQQQSAEPLKCEFSHIELLKFQAKHLEKEEISNNRFPTFAGLTQSEMLATPVENINQFEISQIFEDSRKLRTESTKRRKREGSLSQNTGSITNISQATTNSKFYRTITNQTKNPHPHMNMIIEPAIINYNTTCQNKSIKLDVSSLTGKKNQQFKTIHWKRNKPFTKFFQCKRTKSRNVSEMCSVSSNSNGNGNGNGNCNGRNNMSLKQVEGRRLYQLLTMNRQVIQLEDY